MLKIVLAVCRSQHHSAATKRLYMIRSAHEAPAYRALRDLVDQASVSKFDVR